MYRVLVLRFFVMVRCVILVENIHLCVEQAGFNDVRCINVNAHEFAKQSICIDAITNICRCSNRLYLHGDVDRHKASCPHLSLEFSPVLHFQRGVGFVDLLAV